MHRRRGLFDKLDVETICDDNVRRRVIANQVQRRAGLVKHVGQMMPERRRKPEKIESMCKTPSSKSISNANTINLPNTKHVHMSKWIEC